MFVVIVIDYWKMMIMVQGRVRNRTAITVLLRCKGSVIVVVIGGGGVTVVAIVIAGGQFG